MCKFQKTTGYWVYSHTTPNGMYYIGISNQQPNQRWKKSLYKEPNSLAPYITEYGWENIEHKVIVDGLTKKDAEQWEDRIIQALSMNGLCINQQRSGGICRDNRQAYYKEHSKRWYEEHKDEIKAHHKEHGKQYREDHKEEKKAYDKQRLSTPEGKIYNRVHNYNQNHTPIETPMEAKMKYLETGYIPKYIKNDDLS